MVAIGIIEDDDLLRRNIEEYMALQADYYIAFSMSNIDDIKDAIFPPDVILLDIHLKGHNSLYRIGYIKDFFPDCKIIVMTGEYKDEALLEAIKFGASSFINKPFSLKSLEKLIQHTLKNGNYLEPKVTNSLIEHLQSSSSLKNICERFNLTEKESDILKLMTQGETYVEIAHKCQMSLPNLNHQIRNICIKMDVDSKRKLISLIQELK
jgi:DNA-binding NarL/FixJ family response regulator